VIAKIGHILLAARLRSAVGVRRSHIGREEAKNVAQCHFVAVHVLLPLGTCKVRQMGMSPSMGCNLMSLVVCSLDGRSPRKSGIINLSFSVVVASDEESCLSIVLLQYVQDMLGIDVRAVIVSNGNGSSHCAIVDTSSTIQDVTKLGSRNGRSTGTRWDLVVVASRCEVELTTRCRTVVCTFATPAWSTLVKNHYMSVSSTTLTSFGTAITISARTKARSALCFSIGRSLTLVVVVRDS